MCAVEIARETTSKHLFHNPLQDAIDRLFHSSSSPGSIS
jgi:hypothetical protein